MAEESIKKIEGLDLSDLVTEVSTDLVNERRKQAAGVIKKQLQKLEQLNIDVKNAEKELKKKTESLAKAQNKVDRIKSGDWSVLNEISKQYAKKD